MKFAPVPGGNAGRLVVHSTRQTVVGLSEHNIRSCIATRTQRLIPWNRLGLTQYGGRNLAGATVPRRAGAGWGFTRTERKQHTQGNHWPAEHHTASC